MSAEAFELPWLGCVKLRHLDKVCHLCAEQVTVKNVSKIFSLVPDTVLLVSSEGIVALPDEHGYFSDVDEWRDEEWEVQGTETSKRPSTGVPSASSSSVTLRGSGNGSTGKWKPSAFPPRGSISSFGSTRTQQPVQEMSWQKSIEVCKVIKGAVVATAEHPVTLTAATASVHFVCEKLSLEAFDGAPVCLLDAKNLPIHNADGTKGAKFWKSSKIIKAIQEEEYRSLENKKRGSKQPLATASICIESSSSESEGLQPFKRAKRPHKDETVDVTDKLVAIEELLTNVKNSVDYLHIAKRQRYEPLSTIFNCIICKENSLDNNPVVPQCCNGIVACKVCLVGWFNHSSTCPHCRGNVCIDTCLPFPPLRPLAALAAKDASGSSD